MTKTLYTLYDPIKVERAKKEGIEQGIERGIEREIEELLKANSN